MHLCAKIYVRRSSEHRIGGENAPWAERSRMGHLYRTAWQTKAAPRAKAQITSPVKLRPEPKVQCPEERPDDDLLVLLELLEFNSFIEAFVTVCVDLERVLAATVHLQKVRHSSKYQRD